MYPSMSVEMEADRKVRELRIERINRDGWWRLEQAPRTPLRAKLAGTLVGLANRISPES